MKTPLSRRTLLKGAGVSLALPAALESFAAVDTAEAPVRMFIVHAHLGFYPETFWPAQSGADYEMPRALKALEPLRDDFSIIRGMAHPGVRGGHGAALQVLTGTPSDEKGNGISVDQLAAEHVGEHTRFSSIQMAGSVSVNRSGVKLPSWGAAPAVYRRLFMAPEAKDVEKTVARLQQNQSLLDAVQDQARQLGSQISKADNEKLDEYFTSIRQVERRLEKAEAWAHKPRPEVELKESQIRDIDGEENLNLYVKTWGDLARLALQTDSSRVISWDLALNHSLSKLGFAKTWHGLTHTEKEVWGDFDALLFREFVSVLKDLKNTKEHDSNLLDRTMVLFTSPLGDAGKHTNDDMPALLAGGPFQHGNHLVTDPSTVTPYCNLYVSMLRAMGIQLDQFSTSTGQLRGLVSA